MAHFFNTCGSNQNQIAFGIFCLSWIGQFIGHGVFEGNRPALLDSLSHAVIYAPLFSYFELEEFYLNL